VAQNRTTVVIAHRLSTIIDADVIVVMQDGQIAEQGRFNELLAQDGVFAGMWHQQQQRDGQAVSI
jgi:ATP-binding cassette subfamily B protein